MEALQQLYELLMVHARPWSALELAYILGFGLMLLAGGLFSIWKKKMQWYQCLALLALWAYLAAVLQSCVFTRTWRSPQMQLDLFWSWRLALAGDDYYLSQVLLNILLLMPAGMLLPLVFDRPVALWKSVCAGLAFSMLIESLQLVLGRGLFELDDLFDNTLGCMLGTAGVDGIWLMVQGICALARTWCHWPKTGGCL